jgi:dienelactone hydrolase
MSTRPHEYQGHDVSSRGYVATPDDASGQRPGILVLHEGPGLDDHARRRTEMLGELGYVALAADLFGDGKVSSSFEETVELTTPLNEDPDLLVARTRSAFDELSCLDGVDRDRLGVIGYCFGGFAALEFARTGGDFGVLVGFHPGLDTKRSVRRGGIKPKILVCTGSADPWVNSEKVLAFQEEMTAWDADWQVITYGGAKHAFTNPDVGAVGQEALGYSPIADARAWDAMQRVFLEAFGAPGE